MGRALLDEETRRLRRLVVEFDGATERIARELGVGRTAVSQRLNNRTNGEWWRRFRAERSRRRARERQRLGRARAAVRRAQAEGPGPVAALEERVQGNLRRIARARGMTVEELEAAVDKRRPGLVGELLAEEGWGYGAADAVVDDLAEVAKALGLDYGVGELLRRRT